ncbi:MAG: hypothetical protein RLZZ42_976, partial [Bacteroidota bacterium]
MKTKLHHFVDGNWVGFETDINPQACQLVLVFGSSELLMNPDHGAYLKKTYPNADMVYASTAGEIINDGVFDNSIVATAVELEKSTLKCVATNISKHQDSFAAGLFLKNQL